MKNHKAALSFEPYELALTALGFATTLALLFAKRGLTEISAEVAGATLLLASILYACAGGTSQSHQRIRYFAAYAFVLWFYLAVARITPALGTKLRDAVLLGIDTALFGQTPAVFCERAATAVLSDVMGLCYLTYHVYLIAAVLHGGLAPNCAGGGLSRYLFMVFVVGFAGYLLVPAIGPGRAFPELFRAPLPGGIISRMVAILVTKGSAGFDVFPSLHVLVICVLLDHDWREVRKRFWLMVFPCLGLFVSTMYLRYHYGVDVLAGLVLFLAWRTTFLKVEWREIQLRG